MTLLSFSFWFSISETLDPSKCQTGSG